MTSFDESHEPPLDNSGRVSKSAEIEALRQRILLIAEPDPNTAVLEVGVPGELLTLPLAHRVRRIWAVDASPAKCRALRLNTQSAGRTNINIEVASAENLPLPDAYVELVVANLSLAAVDEDARRGAIHEIRRVLKPNGRIVCADALFGSSVLASSSRPHAARAASSIRARRRMQGWIPLKQLKRTLPVGSATAAWWRRELLAADFLEIDAQQVTRRRGIILATRA